MTEYKAFIVPLLVLMLFSWFMPEFVGNYSKTKDYINIYSCSNDRVDPSSKTFNCNNYPPLLIWFSDVFSSREIFYKQFLLVCFALILPLVLYKATNNWITTWFYFTSTNFFYAIMTASFFSQGLSMILIFSMLFTKNWERIILLFILILTHSYGFLLGLIFFLLLILQETETLNKFYSKISLFCSPIWGDEIPPILNQRLVEVYNSSAHGFTTFNTVLSVLIKRTPLPFLIMSIKGLLDKRQTALLGFMGICFVFGFFYHERGFYFAALPMIIGLTYFYEKTSKRIQMIIIGLSVLMLIINTYLLFVVLAC